MVFCPIVIPSYCYFVHQVNKITDKWNPVVRGKPIPVDLETSYLYLRTNSAEGSGEYVFITYLGRNWEPAGGIAIWFHSPVMYTLLMCQQYAIFSKSLPETQEKHWVIEKRGYRTTIYCNGEQVLDITASSVTCDNPRFTDMWFNSWGHAVGMIKFDPIDTASDTFYTDTGK